MNAQIELLENKLKELEEEIARQNDYFSKLSNEREIIRNNLNTMNGAIQAYRASIQMVREGAALSPVAPNLVGEA
jgi:chromosome segregation ATPase